MIAVETEAGLPWTKGGSNGNSDNDTTHTAKDRSGGNDRVRYAVRSRRPCRRQAILPQLPPSFGSGNRSSCPTRVVPKFVADSPLEGNGFEPSVPHEKGWSFDGSRSSAPSKVFAFPPKRPVPCPRDGKFGSSGESASRGISPSHTQKPGFPAGVRGGAGGARPRSSRRRATCEPSNCSLDTRNSKVRSAISASRSMTRSAFPSRSSCKLKRRGRSPYDKRGRDVARATDSCAFTRGRYRRRNAPFDIMAINRNVGS
jgi:hypothetical protein